MRARQLAELELDPEAAAGFVDLVRHLYCGRAGKPWCTHAVAAIEGRTFLVADARDYDVNQFDEIIQATANAFVAACPPLSQERLSVRTSRDGPHPTLTALLPEGLPLKPAERTLQHIRPALLQRGLMMGLLHPDSSLHPLTPGADGFPYRVPHPFLTVRWAVPGDEVFVRINPELAALLAAWLRLRLSGKKG